MKRLTEQGIERLNKQVDGWDEGIFIQPNYIPTKIKDAVCFIRYQTQSRGGSCWDDIDTVNEIYDHDKPEFKILNLTLEEIGANDEQIAHIKNYMITNESDAGGYVGYYGDFDDYEADWVQLEEIYKYLGI